MILQGIGRQTIWQQSFIAKLTMLISKAKPAVYKQTEKIHYFESQLTDCTPHRTSCRNVSPSFCRNNENHDHSNFKQRPPHADQRLKQRSKPSNGTAKGHSRALSLREQINLRLELERTKKHQGSMITLPDEPVEPLSAIRRMLTQNSPSDVKRERVGKQQKQQSRQAVRRERRVQFQLRQQQLIQLRQEREEMGLYEKLRKDTQQCTFRPRLTTYRRL